MIGSFLEQWTLKRGAEMEQLPRLWVLNRGAETWYRGPTERKALT
jgi:hypothetical protein